MAMLQASGRGSLSLEYLSIQVRTCGKFLCRKETDIVPGPQGSPNSLFSLPYTALFIPAKDRTRVGSRHMQAQTDSDSCPRAFAVTQQDSLISRTECPEAVQTMAKYMGIEDLVPQAMTCGTLGNRLPPPLPQLSGSKMDIMMKVPDL